jgi:uncharacterized membrane protein YhaH (DUF805 family)
MESHPMSFFRAVGNAIVHAADFRGRANRRDFWFFLAFAVAGWLAALTFDLFYLAERLGFMPMEEDAPRWASNAWLLLCALPLASLVVRRMHDHDRSGWLALSVIVLPYLLSAKGTKGPNRYG